VVPVEAPAVVELKPEPVKLLGAGAPAATDTPRALLEIQQSVSTIELAAGPEPVAEEIPQVEAAPVVTEHVPVTAAQSLPEAEPVLTEPVAAKPAEPEPVAEDIPAVEAAAEPEPVAEEIPHIEAAPAVPETVAQKAAEPEPVAERIPPVEAAPVVETAVAPEPVVEEIPHAEAAPVGTEPVIETAAGPQPVAEHVPHGETAVELEHAATPVATELVVETPAGPEPVMEHVPNVETATEPGRAAEHVAAVATEPQTVAAEPEEALRLAGETACPTTDAHLIEMPVLAVAPPAAAVQEPESPIKLHEVPDPLFALAVEIRAVQAARAAALAAPQETGQPDSSGLLELAGVVGVQPAPIEDSEPVAQAAPVEQAAPEHVHATEAAVAAVEASAGVALLAPPEPEKTLILEPVALAPVRQPPAPQPSVAPEPLPQPQPVALAHTEPDGPTLPFAPMQDYTPATSRSIMPVPPRQQILAADSGPRITLPGPTLPPELTRLQDANVVTVIGEQTAQRTKEALPPAKTSGAPGWLVSALVMMVLLAAGLAVVYFLLLPRTVADAKPAPTPAVAATGPAPTGGNSPLAKFVEVTGFRIITSSPDAATKSEVQYLVVNHSAADISDANVFITLRSAKPGQAPLCRFSFKVPLLGPFEAKEMSSPIEKSARGISLPDWQDVRADVQISQ
jgi:nicotinate-nucleotide--dimethylbenzimidazole phosphoribosyltransferase